MNKDYAMYLSFNFLFSLIVLISNFLRIYGIQTVFVAIYAISYWLIFYIFLKTDNIFVEDIMVNKFIRGVADVMRYAYIFVSKIKIDLKILFIFKLFLLSFLVNFFKRVHIC